MTLSLLRNNIPIFSMLLIFLVDLILIATTHYNWNHSMSKYLPLKSNIQQLKSELSTGHLWLEEAISGDIYVDVQKDIILKFKHDEFTKYLNEAKEILSSNEDLEFYKLLLEIKSSAMYLEQISIQRWTDKDKYRIGSDLDQAFDEEFNYSISLIDLLNSAVDSKLQTEFRERKQHFNLILSLFLFINVLAFILLYKIKKDNLKYESRLFEEKQKAETTLFSIADAVITVDYETKVVFANNMAQNILSLNEYEINGKEFEELFSLFDKENKKIDLNIKQSIESGIFKSVTNSFVFKNQKGNEFILQDSIAPIKDKENNIVGAVIVFHNVTKQEKLKDELEKKEALLMQQSKLASMGELIENIAHQWRQPLSGITAAASGLRLEKEYKILEDERFFKSIDFIIDSSNNLSKTIDNFREFFKPKDDIQVLNLNNIISNAIHIMSSKLDTSNIEIIKDLEEVEIKGLSSELIQILTVLMNNSNDAFFENNIKGIRYIFIHTKKLDDSVIITIKDNAGGCKKDNIQRIFEPYFTTKHKSYGRGIGLFMVRELIVKYMQGSIEVSNQEYTYKEQNCKGLEFLIELKKA